MKKRIIITTGGTGGHVFPAQGLADQLKERADIDVLFVGGKLGSNRYFDQSLPFKEVSCDPLRNPIGALKIAKGIYQSYQIINDFKPDLVVGFGSYYTVPTLLGAKLKNVPIILHTADSVPGKVNKIFAPYSVAIGINFPKAKEKLKGRPVLVGLPLRKEYKKDLVLKNHALEYYGLKNDKKTLLVFGGSQGAKAINECLSKVYLGNNLQVIHITGGEIDLLQRAYQKQKTTACVKSYEDKMYMAWSATDFFISRSGASTIAEALEYEMPGILIPYPTAADNHQEMNADYFVQTIGGGEKILEADLCADSLLQIVHKLQNVDQYQKSIKSYKLKVLEQDFCSLILQYLKIVP